jgi:transcriptional regulator with XRE-family HTH domain
MEVMNMIATGAYLRALREAQGLSQGRLAELVRVTVNTIWRVEAGQQEPKTTLIVNLLAALSGRAEDLALLLNDPNATAADAYAVAERSLRHAATHATPEQRQAVAARLRAMADDLDNP